MHHIAVIPGDNVGPEVIDQGIKALSRLAKVTDLQIEFTNFSWGSEHYLRTGSVMPPDGLETLAQFDAIYLGALGDPWRVPDRIISWGLVQQVRKVFDQYINLRPVSLLTGVASPLKDPGQIDIVIVRENTEGEYAGTGGHIHKGLATEVVAQTSVFTRVGVERVIRFAFDMARRRDNKRLVTSATKSNAMKFSMAFWDQVFGEVAAEYPDITTESVHIDALSMFLVTKPRHFDVIVASNLFGDILSDLGAAVCGGIGLAPGANLDPERRYPSMFEPIHGSAPDIAGKGIANPVAAILAGVLMLEFLDEDRAAHLLKGATEKILGDGTVRTPDLGGQSSTTEMGDAICGNIEELALALT
jgi:tartrate dehydrogenase/decarboxylase/D-malate dehydrogenase